VKAIGIVTQGRKPSEDEIADLEKRAKLEFDFYSLKLITAYDPFRCETVYRLDAIEL
jgi:hypothetical protein